MLTFRAFGQDGVDGVEERVERGVERQHEDGHADADFTRDGHSPGCQQSQHTDGEPAEEVRHHDDGESLSYGQVARRAGGAAAIHRVGADGPEDDELADSDDEKENEVEHDHDAE